MKKVLAIIGPTATGKTDLALRLSRKYNGEIVSCDSRQVYKGLDIGTGKEPGKSIKYKVSGIKKKEGYWEINGVKIWMYDVADSKKQYTVKDYVDQAIRVIEDITKRGKLPIIVGGTGFYLKALLDGVPNLDIPLDSKLRGELEKLTLEELQKKMQSLSPVGFDNLNYSDKNNKRRLLRSIEVLLMYPHKIKSHISSLRSKNCNILQIGLIAPREVLKKRIFSRLISRVDQGLIEEAEKLHRNGLSLERMKQLGLEYGMLARLLDNEICKEQFVNELSVKISQYAKRQITWFQRDKNIEWFDITSPNVFHKIEKVVDFWYYMHK